jgi:hypothetical protein
MAVNEQLGLCRLKSGGGTFQMNPSIFIKLKNGGVGILYGRF